MSQDDIETLKELITAASWATKEEQDAGIAMLERLGASLHAAEEALERISHMRDEGYVPATYPLSREMVNIARAALSSTQERCPTCGSDDPDTFFCPDPFHSSTQEEKTP